MDCLEVCRLYGYNEVHNGGECYRNAKDCKRRAWEEDEEEQAGEVSLRLREESSNSTD